MKFIKRDYFLLFSATYSVDKPHNVMKGYLAKLRMITT